MTPPHALLIISIGKKSNSVWKASRVFCTADCSAVNVGSKYVTTPPHALLIICIGEKSKNALVITETSCFTVPTWQAEGNYAEVNWRDIAEHAGDEKFIRVTGDATSAESADVIAVISRFRQKSQALVVSNSVKIDGMAALEEMNSDAVGEIRAFDVLGAIYEHLDEREVETVKGLLE